MAARFAAEEHDCSTRFAVNACIDDVRARRRSEIAPLRERESQLDETERGERAAARRAAIAARQAQAALRPAALPDPPPRVRRAASAAQPAVFKPRPPLDQRARQAEADERARALQQRRQEAEAAQQRIQRRQADREASGRKTDALPVPQAASRPLR
ncbi:MAG: hypothetical protein LH480_07320 [Rubrivivax sp.]|nr:hypothetical protein [Rubrivivax sp.]